MRPRSAAAAWAILGIALLSAAIASALPDDAYQRWQLLDGSKDINLRWIYERCHFDPAPIDVAVIGPSRTEKGVDAPRLAAALAAQGLPAHVVNFSVPAEGRNIDYVIAHELLQTKPPRVLVLGVIEKPSRFGHAAFKYVAPRGLVADPGYQPDLNYLGDLGYLPFRQLHLAAANLFPEIGGLTKTFDPAAFRGDAIDTTGYVRVRHGVRTDVDAPEPEARLVQGVRRLEAKHQPPLLPARFADLEYGDERHYVEAIAAEARAKGVRLMFLYIPYFAERGYVQDRAFYERLGPILDARFIAPHAEWFADYGHLTRTGADHLTDWLTAPVAAALRTAPQPPKSL